MVSGTHVNAILTNGVTDNWDNTVTVGNPISLAASQSIGLDTGSSIIIKRICVTVLNLASGGRATYSSGLLAVGDLSELAIDFNVTTITGGILPTVQFKVSRQGADGILYPIFSSTLLTVGGLVTVTLGALSGAGQAFGDNVQVDMVLGGTSPPTSVTFSASIKGK